MRPIVPETCARSSAKSSKPPSAALGLKLVGVLQADRARTSDEVFLDELVGVDERDIPRIRHVFPVNLHQPSVFCHAQRAIIGGVARLIESLDVARRRIRVSLMYAAHLPKRVIVVER